MPELLARTPRSIPCSPIFRRPSTNISAETIAEADIIFISVNTPTKTQGIGAGRAANVKNCELCARKIAEIATSNKIVVEKSTVPVRTAHAVKRVLASSAKTDNNNK